MKQALCLIAVFLLLTAAKDGSMSSDTKNTANSQQAAMPDANTLALLSDPGFQALFGKGGIFDGTKEEVDNRIAAIETMTKLGPVLQDPNFVAAMQAMTAQQANGGAAGAPAASAPTYQSVPASTSTASTAAKRKRAY